MNEGQYNWQEGNGQRMKLNSGVKSTTGLDVRITGQQ